MVVVGFVVFRTYLALNPNGYMRIILFITILLFGNGSMVLRDNISDGNMKEMLNLFFA